MARNKDIPQVWEYVGGDGGRYRRLRDMTAAELAERDALQKAYDAMLARQQAYEDQRFKQITEHEQPERKGHVFAKSSGLPEGLINYSNPGDFIPVESVTEYGDFAVLASHDATADDSMPLAWMGGSSSATALSQCLGGTLATAPAQLNVLAVALIPDTTSSDWALYTPDQYATLASAKTRARLHVERLPDNAIRAYGFYTGKNRDWENVPVIAATAAGEQFEAELGQGLTLIWTPATNAPMPVVNEAPALPPLWVYPPTETANRILVNPVHPPQYQDRVVWFPKSEIPPIYISWCISKTCPHPDMMEALAEYIAGEMNRNIHDPAVLEMQRLINYDPVAEAEKFSKLPALARLNGPPNFNDIAKAHKAAAALIWTKKVGQDQEWDHKPKLQKKHNGVVWHKQGKYAYFYDTWSNIHYGYVGIICGFTESVLLDGAGLEQIVSDSLSKAKEWIKKPKEDWKLPGPRPTASPWTSLRSWDDVADRVAISIGVKLANLHPHGGLSAKIIMDEVLAIAPENWGDGIIDHKCE